MKFYLSLLLVFSFIVTNAQTNEEKVTTTMKEFHQAMVNKNTIGINQQTDKELSYGHSNGWIETKTDFIKNLETGALVYHSYKEDSVKVGINGNLAHVRFVADINAVNHGLASNNHLRVLEVWVKKGKRWVLFARQAAK
ncbi:MAG: nuclear transport factor 2 family protein [Chitinophagaceae bacterium]